MSITVYPASQQDWSCEGAPQSTVVLGQGGTIYLYDRIVDTVTGNLYRFIAVGEFDPNTQTYINCAYDLIATNTNINSILYKAQGDVTLSLGSANVSCASLSEGDLIQLFYKTPSGTAGAVFVFSVNPGTGFTIKSTSLLDSSEISWKVLN